MVYQHQLNHTSEAAPHPSWWSRTQSAWISYQFSCWRLPSPQSSCRWDCSTWSSSYPALKHTYIVDLDHLARSLGRSHVEFQRLILHYFGYLQRFFVCTCGHRFLEHVKLDVNLHVDVWKVALDTQDVANHAVISGYAGIDHQTDRDQAAWNCIEQRVVLGHKWHYFRADGCELNIVIAVFKHMSRSQFNIHTHLQNSFKNTTSNNSTLKLVDTGARFIDIKTSDNDHFGGGGKISFGDGDIADGLTYSIDVVSLFGWDGNNRWIFTYGLFHKLFDLFVILLCFLCIFEDDIDFVLQNYHVV